MRKALAVLTVLVAQPALAQTAPEASPPLAQPDLEPTLSITAHIEAKSIRIQQRGRTEVSIWSDPGGKGEWKFDRHGVPNPIPLGKTFNNVAFDLDAHATIDDRGLTVGASAAPGQVGGEPPPAAPPPPK